MAFSKYVIQNSEPYRGMKERAEGDLGSVSGLKNEMRGG